MPDLEKYIELLSEGNLVAFPTETVYGLGANAWKTDAISRIFALKNRPTDNPLIVHISDQKQVSGFASEIPEDAAMLMDAFWPGPLTLVLKKKPKVLDIISAGLDSIAIRMPRHALALELISATGPLVAPSANKSGKPSPTKAKHVKEDFGDDFPVIDGGSTEMGIESTVLDVTGEKPVILRPGQIGKEELEAVLKKEVLYATSAPKAELPKSPGQKYTHYKPAADVFYGEVSSIKDENLYLLQNYSGEIKNNIINYNGDLSQFSRELYDRFRQADLENYKAVYIEEFESYQNQFPSLYSALMNRIEKAVGS